jgi:hypothetical protein
MLFNVVLEVGDHILDGLIIQNTHPVRPPNEEARTVRDGFIDIVTFGVVGTLVVPDRLSVVNQILLFVILIDGLFVFFEDVGWDG